MQNIYSRIPRTLKKEFFENILRGDSFRLERIVSKGHSTCEGEWCDHEKDEWVLLLQGSAGIRIKGKKRSITLKPGDYLCLPAHQKHRVEWTQQNTQTVWLAMHYQNKKKE
jgi:cupin 2 domain-containing protein